MKEKNSFILDCMRKLVKASGQGIDALTYTLADILKYPILILTPANEILSSTFPHPDLNEQSINIVSISNDSEIICHPF